MSRWQRAALVGLGLLAGAWAAAAAPSQVAAAPPEASDFVVVDCRLPPKVRKLGTQAIYQTAGQLIRTPAKDCEIRGGEYTLDDPGSYEGAIRRWTPAAEQGDPKAQTNLGALYERLSPPNDQAAAQWYRKAADQGYGPAQIALGELYELGKGVPKDEAQALNLYRKGSGITDRVLDFIEPAADPGPAAPARTGAPGPHAEGGPGPAAEKLAALPPPRIEIIFPLATGSGEQTKLRVRALQNAGNLVGRIVSQAGVAHATVDSQPINVDSEGYFTLALANLEHKPSFHLSASDLLGRSSAIDVSVAQGPDVQADPHAGAAKATIGGFYALIIGNSRFQHWDEIDNAQNDAQALDQLLRTRYGFKTTLLLNATREQMLEAFNNLRETLKENDNLLVYYAGHGHLNAQLDRGYWIPVDSATDSDVEWILNEQITDYLQIIPAKHIMVIADSCYSGVLTRTSVQRPRPGLDLAARDEAIQALSGKRVRTVMTSGGVQPVLDSGSGGHSVFANALLKILGENSDLLEGNRLFDAIAPAVIKSSAEFHYNQTPTYRALTFAGHEGGDFLFVPTGAGG